MSFFDEGDEPTRVNRPARPRQATTASRSSTAPPDPQTARVRQAVGAGVLLLLLILIVVGFKGCLDSRRERALKDYNRDVTSLVTASRDHSEQLFDALGRGGSTDDLQVAINQIRLDADENVKRARNLDVPGDMKPAQRYLMLVLNFRADGIGRIAELLPSAQGNEAGAAEAVDKIAGQMQAFVASDVVYSQRVAPLIRDALNENDVTGQTIPTSQFLDNLGWLDPGEIGGRLGVDAAGPRRRTGDPAPGLHGHGLLSTSVGQLTLEPGESVNRIPASSGLTFNVKFANQGENDETDVVASVKITGAGSPITLRKRVNVSRRGTETTAAIPLGRVPPIGRPVTIEVAVAAVPGEKKTDNNVSKYTAIFTR